MRTSAMRWPSTSKQRAAPGARSSRAHTRRASPTARSSAMFELVDHRPSQPAAERSDRKTIEDVIEEAEHDESFRLVRWHAARLEVVTLIVVDRTDRGRMRTSHVVGFDLEVRDRFRAGTLGQHEIAIRLERVRLLCRRPQSDETAVDRTRLVLDGTLEEQIAPRPGRIVVLERSEVEHLRAVAEIHRELVAVRRLAVKKGLAAKARVIAPERDG